MSEWMNEYLSVYMSVNVSVCAHVCKIVWQSVASISYVVEYGFALQLQYILFCHRGTFPR